MGGAVAGGVSSSEGESSSGRMQAGVELADMETGGKHEPLSGRGYGINESMLEEVEDDDEPVKSDLGLRKRNVGGNAAHREEEHEADESLDDHDSLLAKRRAVEDEVPRCYDLQRWLGWTISRERRSIRLDGRTTPAHFPTNRENNQKYNAVTLVPVVLFDQFKMFYNFFFLVITVSQYIPALKVGFLFTYVAPLAFVLCVTIAKEAFDDWQRKVKDRDLNCKQYA